MIRLDYYQNNQDTITVDDIIEKHTNLNNLIINVKCIIFSLF